MAESLLELKQSQSVDLPQTELEKEFGNIPELESVESIIIPNSELCGAHLILKEGNKITLKEFFEKMSLGKDVKEGLKSQVRRTPFLVVDNLEYEPKSYRDSKSFPYPQPLHHDEPFNSMLLDLYQPANKGSETKPRRSPFLVSDSEVYEKAMVNFSRECIGLLELERKEAGSNWLLQSERQFLESIDPRNSDMAITKEGLVTSMVRYLAELNSVAEDQGSRGILDSRIYKNYLDFLSGKFKPNIVEHFWKPGQLVLLNNISLVHGRGGLAAEERPNYYEDIVVQETPIVIGSIRNFFEDKDNEIH